MNRPRLLSFLLGASLMFVGVSAHAELAIDRFVLRGLSADISADVADECSSTTFFVGGQETVLREGSPASPSPAAFLSYWTFDSCAGTTTLGVASSFEGVQFSGNFNSASLAQTFTVETFTYSDADPWADVIVGTRTATVSVVWAGYGPITADSSGGNLHFPGVVIWNTRVGAQVRNADVMLDVSFDGVPTTFDSVTGAIGQISWANVLIRYPQ